MPLVSSIASSLAQPLPTRCRWFLRDEAQPGGLKRQVAGLERKLAQVDQAGAINHQNIGILLQNQHKIEGRMQHEINQLPHMIRNVAVKPILAEIYASQRTASGDLCDLQQLIGLPRGSSERAPKLRGSSAPCLSHPNPPISASPCWPPLMDREPLHKLA